jgi:hypothetical protein
VRLFRGHHELVGRPAAGGGAQVRRGLRAQRAGLPDRRTSDSLGEAQRAAGDKDGALASYERALAMNPWNTNAAAVLEELRAEH